MVILELNKIIEWIAIPIPSDPKYGFADSKMYPFYPQIKATPNHYPTLGSDKTKKKTLSYDSMPARRIAVIYF